VVTPLAEHEIDSLIAALKAARVEAVAVALLFSFLNPEHERQLGARLRIGQRLHRALDEVAADLGADGALN
jgi:N-methylhydantoinase A